MNTSVSDPQRQVIVERVVELMLDGATLKDAVVKAGITVQTLHRWLSSERELSLLYARAMEIRADIWADQTVEIADTDNDAARARNRINARQWGAAKTHSKKYGERLDVNVNQQISIEAALGEARNRLRPVSDQRDITDVEIHEPQASQAPGATDMQSLAPSAPAVFDGEPDIFS